MKWRRNWRDGKVKNILNGQNWLKILNILYDKLYISINSKFWLGWNINVNSHSRSCGSMKKKYSRKAEVCALYTDCVSTKIWLYPQQSSQDCMWCRRPDIQDGLTKALNRIEFLWNQLYIFLNLCSFVSLCRVINSEKKDEIMGTGGVDAFVTCYCHHESDMNNLSTIITHVHFFILLIIHIQEPHHPELSVLPGAPAS